MQRTMIGAGPMQAGMMVYDTDIARYMFYNGTGWSRIGDGFWMEAGAGIQNSIANVGIGTAPVSGLPLNISGGAVLTMQVVNAGAEDDFGIKVKNTVGTGIAAFSGTSDSGYPVTPTAIYSRGSNGANGAYLTSEGAGTALLAQSQGTGIALDAFAFGTGLAGSFRSGNVYMEERLGIGINAPAVSLHVVSPVFEAARLVAPSNVLLAFYNGASYAGFIQAYQDDFYVGKNNGTGQVVLFNQGASHLELDPQGDVSIGIAGPVANRLRVEGNTTFPVVASQSNYVGNSDVRAFHGTSIPAAGWGYGGEFIGGYRGVYGYANATTFTDNAIGVHGHASGSTGIRTGIYGSAIGGTTNWAGYFAAGNVYVQNDLRLGDAGGAIGYRFSVDGKIICEELKVQNSAAWPDYVFTTDYPLMPIEDLEQHIKEYQHLPGIPSASEVDENGIMVGDMQHRMMEKIEELTLYIIAQEKRIRELEEKAEAKAEETQRTNSNTNSNTSSSAKRSRSRYLSGEAKEIQRQTQEQEHSITIPKSQIRHPK